MSRRDEAEVAMDLWPFFEAVVKEVTRHVPEKGFGYRNPEWLGYFLEEQHNISHRYAETGQPGEALDVAAMAGFAWLHQNSLLPRRADAQSTRVDLGLRERSQRGEAQTGQCPPGFEKYCVLESGEACPNYRDGHCAKVEEEKTP